MKIERELVPVSTIEQFAIAHDLTMVVRERGSDLTGFTGHRYHASFKGVEIRDRGMLVSRGGNGNTEAEAIADYVDGISEKPLVVGAYSESRREIQAPRFIKSATKAGA